MGSKYKMDMGVMRLSDMVSPGFNPRVISDEEFERLKKSIRVFGYQDPIIINRRNNHIVAGNQRFRALCDLNVENHGKYTEVEVIFVDLDLEDEKAFNIGHNRIGGEFDEVKLNVLLDELSEFDYDLDLTGFVEDYDNLDVESSVDCLGGGVGLDCPDEFVVTVKCRNLEEMNSLYERLKAKGYGVKAARY